MPTFAASAARTPHSARWSAISAPTVSPSRRDSLRWPTSTGTSSTPTGCAPPSPRCCRSWRRARRRWPRTDKSCAAPSCTATGLRTSPRRYGKRITDGERDLAGCGQSQEIRKGSERAAVADRCALNAEPRPVRCTPDDLQGVTAKRVGQPIDIVSIAILLYSQVLPEFRPPHLVLF